MSAPQPPQGDRRPFTMVLSALRKTELNRLCLEFRLPTDGSVVALRSRLKGYLNFNHDMLFRNPRYKALFPKHRRPPQPLPPPHPPFQNLPAHPSPPALSYRSSPTHSHYAPWYGIEGDLQPQPLPEPLPLPMQPPEPLHDFPIPPGPPYPPPSPSIASSGHSSQDSQPLPNHAPGECKFLYLIYGYPLPISDTMQSSLPIQLWNLSRTL